MLIVEILIKVIVGTTLAFKPKRAAASPIINPATLSFFFFLQLWLDFFDCQKSSLAREGGSSAIKDGHFKLAKSVSEDPPKPALTIGNDNLTDE